jgi:magnesium-protoporphyrin IX monomethyl ester (oxidative) cyclase
MSEEAPMYKIVLLNLPFTDTRYPSIALTQLKYVLDEKFSRRVTTEIHYLNHDFVHYLGSGLHEAILQGHENFSSGLADWFFRQTAFPVLPDNTDEYLRRFYPGSQKQARWFYTLLKKRQGLEAFLDEMIEKYHLGQAHLVGLTSMFSQNLACFSMARKLKEVQPDIVTVMGGANCETPMGEEIVKNVEAIDFVFSGPALISFPQFVGYRLDCDFESCHHISGVFSKANCLPEERRDTGRTGASPVPTRSRDSSESSRTGASSVPTDEEGSAGRLLLPVHASLPQTGSGTIGKERDINEVVELDYRSFLQSIRTHFPNKEVPLVLLFETSRGCWWGERSHCTFCGLNGLSMNYRSMHPQKAVASIQSLFDYAEECPYFNCIDNILPRNYPKEVLPFLDTPPNVTLFYEVKADLSEQDIQALSQARVNVIQPGIEALSTSILKLMKKGTTAFQNLRLLKHCATYEVFPLWNFLMGFPGEKEEVYQKYLHDLPLLHHLPPPTTLYPLRFDRYSPYFTLAEEYGLDLEPFASYELIYPFSKESLRNLAYYFTDQNQQADYSVTLNQWFGKMRAQAEQWKRAWQQRGEMQGLWGKWYQQKHPQLLFKQQGHETIIYDSRSGKPLRYQISDTSKRVLQYLDQPHRKADLIKQFDHLSHLDIEQEIAFLQDRGLLFEEDDRYLSLVLPGEPSTSSPAVRKKVELQIAVHP